MIRLPFWTAVRFKETVDGPVRAEMRRIWEVTMVPQVSSISLRPECALSSSPNYPFVAGHRTTDRGNADAAAGANTTAATEERPARPALPVFGIRVVSAGSREEACRRWRELRENHPELLARLTGVAEDPPLVRDGTPPAAAASAGAAPAAADAVWHVQARPFARLQEAADFCRALRRERVPCLIIRRT